MTLAVSPLGERGKKKEVYQKLLVYLLACTVTAGLLGYFLSFLIYWGGGWLGPLAKTGIIAILLFLYLLKEVGILPLPTIERKWQIPPSWVNHRTPSVNMTVWGAILGAGLFTYNPYAGFFLMYLYIGFFLEPLVGLSIGCVYGLARVLPTIWLSLNPPTDIIETIWSKGKSLKGLHGLLLVVFLLYVLFS